MDLLFNFGPSCPKATEHKHQNSSYKQSEKNLGCATNPVSLLFITLRCLQNKAIENLLVKVLNIE